MSIKERLKELGIELPPANKPTGSYVPATASETLCFSSGKSERALPKSEITEADFI